MSDLPALSKYFAVPWKNEAIRAGSPLYAALCDVVAGNESLLRLASNAQAGQPAPNMLFAAVQATLADHPGAALREYYPSFGGTRLPDEQLAESFAEFCERSAEPIVELLRTRLVQTNEVRRSAFLLPALSFAWRESGRKPLSLVEVGPSAGLNLLFDRYRYAYRGGPEAGNAESAVTIDADVRGTLGDADVEMPVIEGRIGIDINPLDVRDAADAAWLSALTFPEHEDRRQLLSAAMGVVRDADLDLVRGDALDLLPGIFASVPEDAAPCVVATFVLHQLVGEQRIAFQRMLEEESRKRPFYMIAAGYSGSLNWDGLQADGSTFVKVGHYSGGVVRVRTLIHCHPHGRWLEYLHNGDWEAMR